VDGIDVSAIGVSTGTQATAIANIGVATQTIVTNQLVVNTNIGAATATIVTNQITVNSNIASATTTIVSNQSTTNSNIASATTTIVSAQTAVNTTIGLATNTIVSNQITTNTAIGLSTQTIHTESIDNSRLDHSSITFQGNTFNGNSQLVQTTSGGLLPVISGANLTSLTAENITGALTTSSVITSTVTSTSSTTLTATTINGALSTTNSTTLGDGGLTDTFTLNYSTIQIPSSWGTRISTTTNGTGTPIAFFDGVNQRVGINTITPSRVFEVNGQSKFVGNSYCNNYMQIAERTGAYDTSILDLYFSATSATMSFLSSGGSGCMMKSASYLTINGGTSLTLQASGSSAMALTTTYSSFPLGYKVGIGNTSPAALLDVLSKNTIAPTGYNVRVSSPNADVQLCVQGNGNVGISTGIPQYPLDVVGVANFQDDVNIGNSAVNDTFTVIGDTLTITCASNTINGSLNVNGNTTATHFYGEGSNITGISGTVPNGSLTDQTFQ
jgi:hypothetical protein